VLDPSDLPIVGPGTPYINPSILTAAPTGISWGTIPDRKSTPDQQYAEQVNLCARATSMVDQWCNQPLRATVDTEQWTGPGDFRCQNQPTGVTRLLSSRFPVVSVLGGQVSSATAFPRSWNTIPANQFDIEVPLLGTYGTSAPGGAGGGGQAILVAPGNINWVFGRLSSIIQVTYINGWPHGSLTAGVAAGVSSLAVDDITGWDGAVGVVYDGAAQEAVAVTAVTPSVSAAVSGPGVLTLQVPLSFTHQEGTIVSALPGAVIQAAILFGTVQALTRGATATAVQSLSGAVAGGGGGGVGPDSLLKWARSLIAPYRRII
jgi:hypothetical protein